MAQVAATQHFSYCASFLIASSITEQDAASHEVHEVHEGWCQGHEQGRHDKRARNQARVEAGGMLQDHQQPGDNCNNRSKEDWNLHHSRPLSHQDPCQASHKSWCQDYVWQGGEGQGQGSENSCKGFPCCCTEEADLGIYLPCLCF